MKIIEGDFAGSTGKITVDASGIDVMRITGQTYTFPASFESIKLINKEERRPLGLIILLCTTVVGIPLAILLAVFWKRVTVNIGFKFTEGKIFLAKCDGGEWKIVSKYIGTDSPDRSSQK